MVPSHSITMKLTIIGATGGIGRQLVEQAVEGGHDVTAVVRDPRRLSHAVHSVTVDLASPDSTLLQAAIRGADAVLSGLGARSAADAAMLAMSTEGSRP